MTKKQAKKSAAAKPAPAQMTQFGDMGASEGPARLSVTPVNEEPETGLRMNLDGRPVLVKPRFAAALQELGEALLEQGAAVDEEFPKAWAWCRIKLGDLAATEEGVDYFDISCGGDPAKPDALGRVVVIGV